MSRSPRRAADDRDAAGEGAMRASGGKLAGFDFWWTGLGGARKIVAPMVDQSELAWRLLSRRHGAELCYTPMLNAKIFLEHTGYREREFQTCAEDHPLIAQFCGHDPDTIARAAKQVQDRVEAVDLNLGCPQNIAKKGHYGAYLQDEWDLVRSIVSTLHRELAVPVTAKIRVFDDAQKTIRYAQMVQDAGAQIITVHGRTREQRGHNTGVADWHKIRLVKEALSVPVFANGNILFGDDIDRCLTATGANGVMTAEGNLHNPALFETHYPLVWDIVDEYLDICRHEAPAPLTSVRGHLFKILRPCLAGFVAHRTRLGEAKSLDEIAAVASDLCALLREDFKRASPELQRRPPNHSSSGLSPSLPPWFCRAFVRDLSLSATGTAAGPLAEGADAAEPLAKVIKVGAS